MRRKGICLFLLALFFWAEIPSAMAAEDLTAYFEAARAALETPAQQALTDGEWELRTGETVAAPFVSTEVIPYDEQAERPLPACSMRSLSRKGPLEKPFILARTRLVRTSRLSTRP